jgi:hypothetical protein
MPNKLFFAYVADDLKLSYNNCHLSKTKGLIYSVKDNLQIWIKLKLTLFALWALKVEIFLEQREVVFLSPSKICENLIFSTVHL